MTREEAKRRLLDIERCTPIHTREDARDFEALEMAIKSLEQNESAEEWYKLFVKKLDEQENNMTKVICECDTCKYYDSGECKKETIKIVDALFEGNTISVPLCEDSEDIE